jgi:hypothetical protein
MFFRNVGVISADYVISQKMELFDTHVFLSEYFPDSAV